MEAVESISIVGLRNVSAVIHRQKITRKQLCFESHSFPLGFSNAKQARFLPGTLPFSCVVLVNSRGQSWKDTVLHMLALVLY